MNHFAGPGRRFATRLHEIHHNLAVERSQHTRSNLDTSVKAAGSQTAPMLFPPCPTYAPRCSVPLKGPVNGCRFSFKTVAPPKLFMCRVPSR